jgi:hypothetical protein
VTAKTSQVACLLKLATSISISVGKVTSRKGVANLPTVVIKDVNSVNIEQIEDLFILFGSQFAFSCRLHTVPNFISGTHRLYWGVGLKGVNFESQQPGLFRIGGLEGGRQSS